MKIVKRGLLPNERTYKAQCKYCETEVEFLGKEAINYRIVSWFRWFFKHWKLVGCPVCDRTIKTEFKNGYRANPVFTNSD